ncbi:MAG: hypothetical protein PHT84_00970 [Candidatus Pacebacteria bacterium]|jgi:hypothetical protein|nr:hypothetical protein [Candidatus Paceibacterota bacterium]
MSNASLKKIAMNSFILFFVIAIIFAGINSIRKSRSEKKSKKTEKVQSYKSTPSYYEKEVSLKKGEIVIVQIPRNYYYGLDGGGQKYYRQAYHKKSDSYGEKELVGGGLPVKDSGSDIGHLRLSPYEKEITVVIIFSKDKSQIK